MQFNVLYNLLTAPWTVSNTYSQVAMPQSCANHVQHIGALIACNMSCATWYEGTAQLLSLAELKSHLFYLYFVGWYYLSMKEGTKREYPEKTPDNKLQKLPHTKARKSKPQTRLDPALWHWWQARKADVLTITPHVASTWYSVATLPYAWHCRVSAETGWPGVRER